MMVKKAITGIMITLLLVSVVHFAAVNSVARATGFKSDLVNYEIFSKAEDWWVMFRHDLNHTGYSNSTVPIQLCQLWNTTDTINGSVRSSPAIVDDKVFVGSSDKNVYVLNATTGKKKIGWNYTTDGAVESSPAVVDNMVFVGSMNGTVYALRANGLSYEWSSSIGGAVKSSPAVADGKVFLGSDDGYVYALNATRGYEIWKFRTAYAINSSPAVSGGRVFIGVTDGRVYALNMMGRYEWHFATGDSVESSPAVADGIVFVGSDDKHVYAINETTGKQIWNYTTGGEVKSSPAVAYGMVFIGSMNGSVYALNETTGNFLWNFPTEGFVYSSPAVADDKVFVGSGDNRTYVLNVTTGSHICNFTTGGPIYSSPAVARNMVFIGSDDKKVYAFGPKNKPPQPHIKVKPTKPFILQTVTFNGSESIDPDGHIVSCTWDFDDGTIIKNVPWEKGEIVTHAYGAVGIYNVTLAVTDDHSIPAHRKTNSTWQRVTVQEAWPMYRHDWNHTGYSTSLAPVTNVTMWELRIGPDVSIPPDPWMYPSPTVVRDEIYIGSTNGTIFAFYTNRSLKWSRQLGGRIFSSPAVVDGLVFIGSEDYDIYALNATTGEPVWNKATGGPIYPSPVVVEGRVFIGSQDGRVYAFNKTNGYPLWNKITGGSIHASPAIADGKVFIGSADGVYAWYTDGTPAWSYISGEIFDSSPAVAHGIVFIGSDDGYVYALNATKGQRIWREKIGNKIKSSPAVADDTVFVCSDSGTVFAYSITGNLIWSETIGSVGWSSPAVADCKVFVGSTDGKIYALHKEDGTEVWSYETGGSVDSSPAVLNDTLYVASKKGTLYAFWNKTHDVAVIVDTPKRNETIGVAPNGTVNIIITLENQGSFNETNINVTVYYSNVTYRRVANSTVVDLLRHNKKSIKLPWNVTNVAEGNYIISANATLAIDEDPTDNDFIGGNVFIGVRPDINVTDVWPGCNVTDPAHRVKTVVGQNCNVTIYVTVKNEGNLTATDIGVTVYWSNSSHTNQTIRSAIIDELLKNASKTISIPWNTTGVAKGNYTIKAYAWPVPSETDTADNTFTDGTVYVGIPGDVDGNNFVEIKDILPMALAYGSYPGHPKYEPNLDVNDDKFIDIKDILTAALNYGQTYP